MKQLIFILTLFAVSACGSKESNPAPEPTLNSTEVKTNYDKTFQFSVENGAPAAWESSNTTIGTISSSGIFTAKRIGETTVTATVGSKKLTAKVVVEPYATLVEPIVKKGLTREEIKAFEKHEYQSENENGITYSGDQTKGISNFGYSFFQGEFYQVSYVVFKEQKYYDYLLTYFKERYDLDKKSDPNKYIFNVSEVANAEIDLNTGSFLYKLR